MGVAALGAAGPFLVPFDCFGPRGEGVAQRRVAFARTSTPLRKLRTEAAVAPHIKKSHVTTNRHVREPGEALARRRRLLEALGVRHP